MDAKKCDGCENKEMEHSLEWEMMKELVTSKKRMFALVLIVLALWFTTIVGFVWYINQYDYTSYEVQQDGEWGNTFIDGGNEGDITYGAENISEKEDTQESSQG